MRTLKHFFTISVLLMMLTGCSSSPKVEANSDGEYSSSDYAEMVDYMYAAMSEMEVINRTADPSDLEEVRSLCQQVVREYPYAKQYLNAYIQAIADENEKLLEEADKEKLSIVIDYSERGWFNQW